MVKKGEEASEVTTSRVLPLLYGAMDLGRESKWA